MLILTAADKKFQKYVDASKKQAEKFGYKFLAYDLNGTEFPREDGVLKNLWKFPVIYDAFKNTTDKIVWMDADALLWNTIDLEWDFDVGVTVRRQKEMVNGEDPLNSGVMFFNRTEDAGDFLLELSFKDGKTDQTVVSDAVREVTEFTEYNKIVERKGAKIKLLKTDRYNCYYFNEKLNREDNRILHFKGNMRDMAKKFINV